MSVSLYWFAGRKNVEVSRHMSKFLSLCLSHPICLCRIQYSPSPIRGPCIHLQIHPPPYPDLLPLSAASLCPWLCPSLDIHKSISPISSRTKPDGLLSHSPDKVTIQSVITLSSKWCGYVTEDWICLHFQSSHMCFYRRQMESKMVAWKPRHATVFLRLTQLLPNLNPWKKDMWSQFTTTMFENCFTISCFIFSHIDFDVSKPKKRQKTRGVHKKRKLLEVDTQWETEKNNPQNCKSKLIPEKELTDEMDLRVKCLEFFVCLIILRLNFHAMVWMCIHLE